MTRNTETDLYGEAPEAHLSERDITVVEDSEDSIYNKTETYFRFKELIVKEF